MVERIPDLPGDALGFSAKGTVTASDYEQTIVPAVEEAFARGRKVRFLYHLGPAFTSFDAAAVWDDTVLGLKHFGSWERIAVVTDADWLRAAVQVFGLVIPGQVRVFRDSELAEAKRWVAE